MSKKHRHLKFQPFNRLSQGMIYANILFFGSDATYSVTDSWKLIKDCICRDTFSKQINMAALALLQPAFWDMVYSCACMLWITLLQLITPTLQAEVHLRRLLCSEQMFHQYSRGINSDLSELTRKLATTHRWIDVNKIAGERRSNGNSIILSEFAKWRYFFKRSPPRGSE